MSRDEENIWADIGDTPLTERQQKVISHLTDRGMLDEAAYARWHWSRGQETLVMRGTVPDAIIEEYEWANDEAAGRTLRKYVGMRNRRMQELLNAGECIDVSGYEKKDGIGTEGAYFLEDVTKEDIEAKDLCNANSERWIRSVGVHKETGRMYASHRNEFYKNPAFRCVWLR